MFLKLADGSGWVPAKLADVGTILTKIHISTIAEALSEPAPYQIGASSLPNETIATAWEVFLEWGWGRYDPQSCKLLNEATSRDLAAIDIPMDRKKIVVDLVSMQQINLLSGNRRAVRRCMIEARPSSGNTL